MALTRVRNVILIILAAAYFVFLLQITCFFAAGPDSAGYCSHAKLIASRHVRYTLQMMRDWGIGRDLVVVFEPLGFATGPRDDTMVPSYPAGVPVLLAAAAAIGGWKTAPFVVVPLLAIVALAFLFLVGRELGLPVMLAFAGPVILGAYSIFIRHAIQPVSDVAAAAFALVAIWCALRSQRRAGYAIAAGVAFAFGVWVRPTNFLLIVPLLIAFRLQWSSLWRAAIGAMPLGAALAWYQALLYGSPWKTGYGTIHDVITLGVLTRCAMFHARTMAMAMTPLIVPGGLLVVADRRVSGWTRALLVVWFLIFFAFYSVYNVCVDDFSVRFLLPALPALIIGFLLMLRDRTAIALLLIGAVLFYEGRDLWLTEVWRFKYNESVFPETVAWAEPQLRSDAVVLSMLMSGAMFYYTGRVSLRFDMLAQDGRMARVRASAASVLPWYALLSDIECDANCLQRLLPGRWQQLGRNRDVTLWRYAGP